MPIFDHDDGRARRERAPSEGRARELAGAYRIDACGILAA
jgi:hypothetical protein